ncbi:hypothetical protein IT413_01490 [Candidatus Peregrinibacteria bacterium]|nr:hypothetical protein [Candidatus Peregrinibacteria bacterium]
MIRRQHGIKNKYTKKPPQDYFDYLDSQIGFGIQIENSALEESFIEIFSSFADDMFFYSNFSTKEAMKSSDIELNDHFSFEQKPQYGIVIHLRHDVLTPCKTTIFTSLRIFLLECIARNKNQLIALKITYEDCYDHTFKLPKNLTFIDLGKAVKCFQNQYRNIISKESSFNKTFIFDRYMEVFVEE